MESEDVLARVADETINLRPPIPHSCPLDVGVLMKACFHTSPNRRPSSQDAFECIRDMQSIPEGGTESLLAQMFPAKVADALRDGRKIEPTAHECVTVFFSDIVC